MVNTGMNAATQLFFFLFLWHQNASAELMIATLFLTAPKGAYKYNQQNACMWTMMDA